MKEVISYKKGSNKERTKTMKKYRIEIAAK